MPNVLNLKPEEIDSKEKRSKYLLVLSDAGKKESFLLMPSLTQASKLHAQTADPSVDKKISERKNTLRRTRN